MVKSYLCSTTEASLPQDLFNTKSKEAGLNYFVCSFVSFAAFVAGKCLTGMACPILLKSSTVINFHSTEKQRVSEMDKYQKYSRFAFSFFINGLLGVYKTTVLQRL